MKKQITMLALAVGMLMSFNVMAQQKIGHINADQLLQMMPETKTAQGQLEAYGKQLEKEIGEMETELQTKIDTYKRDAAIMTSLAKESKGREIQELQYRIQEYSQNAQEDLQNKQMELLTPIIEKATKAVQEVAKENNFTYILDSSPSKAVVIFASETTGEDITNLVKAKLGIQ